MERFKFYEVSKEYLLFLKKYDDKIPNQNYKKHDKFFCGIVLEIEGFKYYVPVSHNIKPTQTSFILKNKQNTAICSLRFCFMIPVPDIVLTYKDFSKEEDIKYVKLLEQELKICKINSKAIKEKAKKVYKIGCTSNHPLNKFCCQFKKLEEVSEMYSA